jgi:CHAD domain-containing protein
MKRAVSNRPVLPVNTVHPFLAKELQVAWKAFLRRWRKCRTKPSESAVHALRVEARRLLAELELLTGIGLEAEAGPLGQPIKKLLSALSKLRDVQVQRELLRAWKPEFADRSWLERELRRLARRQRGRVVDKLEDFPARRLAGDVRALAKAVRARRKAPHQRAKDARLLILVVNRSFARVDALRRLVRINEPATVHAVRVAFKAFRYQVEFLAPQLGLTEVAYLERLRKFQSHLGNFNDADVWLSRLDELLAEHPKRTGLVPLRRAVVAQARRLLKRSVAELDQVATYWPPPATGRTPGAVAPPKPV